MINNEADETIKELFDSLKNKKNNLGPMKGSLPSITFIYCNINVTK